MSQKKAQIPLKQEIPGGEDRKILLHACCAPCSGAIIEYMLREGIRPAVFFSNANIFPVKEYEIRREECRRWCEKNGLTFIDDDYDHPHWQSITKGLEKEPERGRRCLWACGLFPDVTWWGRNWRTGGLQQRRGEIIREQCFYNQLYCGCEFSLAGRHDRPAEVSDNKID